METDMAWIMKLINRANNCIKRHWNRSGDGWARLGTCPCDFVDINYCHWQIRSKTRRKKGSDEHRLWTAASDEAEPLTGDRVGEYLQQLLRTHTADTQFSMLSTSEKEMVRNLASLAPNGDDLKKTFAKVL
eukprot:s1947_g3.t1